MRGWIFLMRTARAYLKITGMKYALANEKVMLQNLFTFRCSASVMTIIRIRRTARKNG